MIIATDSGGGIALVVCCGLIILPIVLGMQAGNKAKAAALSLWTHAEAKVGKPAQVHVRGSSSGLNGASKASSSTLSLFDDRVTLTAMNDGGVFQWDPMKNVSLLAIEWDSVISINEMKGERGMSALDVHMTHRSPLGALIAQSGDRKFTTVEVGTTRGDIELTVDKDDLERARAFVLGVLTRFQAQSDQSSGPEPSAAPAAPPPPPGAKPSGWYTDPTGRTDQRYFDGSNWTSNVMRSGEQGTDPLQG